MIDLNISIDHEIESTGIGIDNYMITRVKTDDTRSTDVTFIASSCVC